MSKKILVIDDERELCSVLVRYLEKRGFMAMAATNGSDGIRLADLEKPDLILLDINMPQMNGCQVIEKLKNSEKTMSIPVVMLTAYKDDEHKLKAAGLYSERYLTKPISLNDLEAEIKKVLRLP